MTQEPKASKIVSVQLAFGQDDPRNLDEITASVKDWLAQLDPKRITIMDEYWLVNGVRVTRADLTRAAAVPATPVPDQTVDDESAPVVLTPRPGESAAIARRQCAGGCGTICTKDNADKSDDGSWLCHACQAAA